MKSCSLTLIFLFSMQASAKDFGIQGQSWEIKEEGFISMIINRLKNIDINKLQQDFFEAAKKSFERPRKVDAIQKATQTKSYLIDPSYVLDQDIILPSGNILYKSGYRVNPFDHMSLDGKLILLDGDDKNSVTWFKSQSFNDNDKLILVSGSPKELTENLNRYVYFDQFGEITKKFGIKVVPSILSQEDKMLKIEEIKVD